MKQIHLYSCFLSSIKTKDSHTEKELVQEFLSTASSCYESVTIECVRTVFRGLPETEQYRIKNYEYLKHRLEDEEIPFNPKWLASGYFMWKPVMIKEALNRIPEDSFLVYHDFNIRKYSQYASNISKSPLELINELGDNKSILVFRQYGKRIQMDVKQKIISDFSLHPNHLGFWAGCIILRNNAYSRGFVAQWADLCNEENTLPIPDKIQTVPQANFCGHSADQAMLTALAVQNKNDGLLWIKTLSDRNIHDRWPTLTRLITKSRKAAIRPVSFYIK